MIVIDPPEREPRRYQREWQADRWRGTLAEFVSAVEAALEEVRPHISYQARPAATFEYRDESHQVVNGIEALRQTAESSDPSEIKNLLVELQGPPSFTISGVASRGLTVKAEGSHGFAVGMVGMLAFRLSEGKEAAEKVAPPSVRPLEWCLIAVAPVLFMAMFLVMYFHFDYRTTFALIGFALVSAGVAFIPLLIVALLNYEYALRVGPPRFVLVEEGEQVSGPSESRKGPIWAAHSWFKSHPAVALLATAVFSGLVGVVITKAVEAL